MLTRYIYATTTGVLMTFSILYLMQLLIAMGEGTPESPRERRYLGFAPTIDDRPVITELEERFKELTEPVEALPERPIDNGDRTGEGISIGTPNAETPNKPTFYSGSFNDGPLVNVVRVRPAYPARATTQGIEGYVDVQFDVATDGTVQNVVVIHATHRIFEESAINAAKRFRYKARGVDGIPQPSYGIRNRFRFEMDRG